MIPPTAAGIIGTEFMIAYLVSTATYILNTTKQDTAIPSKARRFDSHLQKSKGVASTGHLCSGFRSKLL
jgi:hypothetical protein